VEYSDHRGSGAEEGRLVVAKKYVGRTGFRKMASVEGDGKIR
jgi:hypothetical protein